MLTATVRGTQADETFIVRSDGWSRPASAALVGRGGDDRLTGGGGDDRLVGGAGRDTGDGRDGTDVCVSIEVRVDCD